MACRAVVPCLLAAALCIARATEPSSRLATEPESATQRPGGEVRLRCVGDPGVTAPGWQRLGGASGSWEDAARPGVTIAGTDLLIPALRPELAGAYRCVAGNGSATSAPANVTLAHLGEFRWHARRALEATLGESAIVRCSLPESLPPAVPRYKFKQKWLDTTAGRVELLPSGTLRIANVSRGDAGVYRCAAYNPVTHEHRVQRGGTRLRVVEKGGGGGGAAHGPSKEEAEETTTTERAGLSDFPLQDEPAAAEDEEEEEAATPGPVAGDGGPTTASAPAVAMPTDSLLRPPEAPIMLSSPRSSAPYAYELRWRPGRDGGAPIMAYLVKYRKVTAGDTVVWQSMRVPADQRSLSLSELEADSLYELEMVARSRAGNGQPAMLTFRTAKEKNRQQKIGVRIPTRWNHSVNDDGGVDPPEPDATHTVPEPPWGVSVRSGAGGAVFVSWVPRGTGGSPVGAFRVESRRLGRGGGEWTDAAAGVPPAKLAVQINGLAPGWAYRFRVAALNAHGESPWSVPSAPFYLSGSPGGAAASQRMLAAPHISATEAVSDTAIRITWTFSSPGAPAQPVQGVAVYYRPTDSDNDEDYRREVLHGSRDLHVLNGLQPETSYDIKIQWFSAAGESEFSNVMICETRAAGSLLEPAEPVERAPPPPPSDAESVSPHTAPSRDLLYLLLGMGLGLLLLILILFIGLWVWRARQHCHGYGSPGPVLPSCKAEYLYPGLDYASVALPGTGLINGGIVGPAVMNGGSPSAPSGGLPPDERSEASGPRGGPGGPGAAAAAAAAVASSCCCGGGVAAGLWDGGGGGGGGGAVGLPSAGHHLGCGGCVGCVGLEYQQRRHHALNGRGLYHAVPQTESAECNDCRNCSNNNRCSPKPGRSSPAPQLPVAPLAGDASPRGDERDLGGGDAVRAAPASPPGPCGEPGSAERSETDTTSESDGEPQQRRPTQPVAVARRAGAALANGRRAAEIAEQGGIRHVRVRPVSDYIRPSTMDYQMDRTKMQNGGCKHAPTTAGSNGLYLEMQLLKVS